MTSDGATRFNINTRLQKNVCNKVRNIVLLHLKMIQLLSHDPGVLALISKISTFNPKFGFCNFVFRVEILDASRISSRSKFGF